ncbi:MAG: Cd(II)/Pb(II)-responsive transcriptional regulator [Gammaproteobacteria bacterium]|nr:Cd(II)/Pb(II)-responsive transcriptional regulator [Gammaproteobacteria bacterium]
MRIGDLARVTRTSVETIRFYERVGLLPMPRRSSGNYRMYDATHEERLQFIRNCRSLDMTLDEVRLLLATKDDPDRGCTDVHGLLDEHIEHVTSRIADLTALEQTLRALRLKCGESRPGGECGILTGLPADGARRVSGESHVAGSRKSPAGR